MKLFGDTRTKYSIMKTFLPVMLGLMMLFSVFAMDISISSAGDGEHSDGIISSQQNSEEADETQDDVGLPDADGEPQPDPKTQEESNEPDFEYGEEENASLSKTGAASDIGGGEYDAEGVVVKFKEKVSIQTVNAELGKMNSKMRKSARGNVFLVDMPKGKKIPGFVQELKSLENVEYVQPNYVYKLIKTTNDPLAGDQWHLGNIKAFDAWDITMGNPGIKVAVLDTGADLNHPDLSSQIDRAWNVLTESSTVVDNHGHGTHVAGIIAATADNGIGVAGVAPGTRLIIVDVFNENTEPGTTTFNVIKGIEYAVANGAHVINMSLGGYTYDYLFELAVNNAVNNNVVVVAAAGNDATSQLCYPSDFESAISVIATTQDNVDASFSNFGQYKDISAPGVNILSTFKSGGYVSISGTSMASPIVAGVVALIRSVNPGLSVDEVKNILYTTANDVYGWRDGWHGGFNYPVGWDAYTGYGIVNARNAVWSAAKPILTVTPLAYNSIRLSWDAVAGADGYEVYLATSSNGTYSKVADLTSGFATEWTTNLALGTTYYYKLRAYTISNGARIFSAASEIQSAAPSMPAPTGLKASASSYNKIKLSWNKVSGASGYEVYRATAAEGPYSLIKTQKGNSFTNSSLNTGTTYYYKVRTYRTINKQKVYSDLSGAQSVQPMLSKPGSLKTKTSGYNTARLTWRSVKGASGYEVYRAAADGGTYNLVGTTASRSFTDKTLEPYNTYHYKVRAYRNVSGGRAYGPESDVKTARTVLSNTRSVKSYAAPPLGLRLSWKGVPGATSYQVYRSTLKTGTYILAGTSASTSFTDQGLDAGRTYYYRIRACRTVGESSVYGQDSPIRAAKAPTAVPKSFKAARVTPQVIKLSWNAVAGAAGYEIYRSASKTGTYEKIGTTSSLSYIDEALESGMTYYYKVRMYMEHGGSTLYGQLTAIRSARA